MPCEADAESRAWHVAANDVRKGDMVGVAEDLIAAIKAKALGRDSDQIAFSADSRKIYPVFPGGRRGRRVSPSQVAGI